MIGTVQTEQKQKPMSWTAGPDRADGQCDQQSITGLGELEEAVLNAAAGERHGRHSSYTTSRNATQV